MLEKILQFVFVVVGCFVLIKYLAPALGEFAGLAIIIIAIIGIVLGLYILAGDRIPGLFK